MNDEQSATRARHPLHEGPTEWARLRLGQNLSLGQLAERSGLPKSVVGLICQGRLMPRPDEAAALLRALKTDY